MDNLVTVDWPVSWPILNLNRTCHLCCVHLDDYIANTRFLLSNEVLPNIWMVFYCQMKCSSTFECLKNLNGWSGTATTNSSWCMRQARGSSDNKRQTSWHIWINLVVCTEEKKSAWILTEVTDMISSLANNQWGQWVHCTVNKNKKGL